MTQLDQIIEEQSKFLIEQSILLLMLKTYKNNTDEFTLLFSKEVREYYKFDFSNDEYIWESLSELCNDFVNNEKQFCLSSCGIFETLHFAKPKKKKLSIEHMYSHFYKTSQEPWAI